MLRAAGAVSTSSSPEPAEIRVPKTCSPSPRNVCASLLPTVSVLSVLEYSVPLLLAVAVFWLAWRAVNMPTFADFLIATEAEMNKVSWTTRHRLFQDTVVVLVTMVLMAVFLFLVDIAWARLLSSRPIGVLKVSDQKEKPKKESDLKW